MATIKNYELNPPKKLSDLNKDSMLEYVIAQNDDEALDWFIKLVDSNKIKKVRTMDSKNGSFKKGDVYEDVDLPPVRRAFARRYFPALVEKKNKPTTKEPSFTDKLEEARKRLNK